MEDNVYLPRYVHGGSVDVVWSLLALSDKGHASTPRISSDIRNFTSPWSLVASDILRLLNHSNSVHPNRIRGPLKTVGSRILMFRTNFLHRPIFGDSWILEASGFSRSMPAVLANSFGPREFWLTWAVQGRLISGRGGGNPRLSVSHSLALLRNVTNSVRLCFLW